MTSPIDRRKFLKAAGATAAAGLVVGGTAEAASAAPAVHPSITPILITPIIPIFFFGTTDYLDITDFTAMQVNSASTITYGGAQSGVIYPTTAGNSLVGTLKIPVGATLTSVSVLTKGAASITAWLYAHDMTNFGYVNSAPLATVTAVPPASGVLSITGIPASLAVPADHKMEVWISGLTSTTPCSGVKYTYQPVNTGYFPISPTRVYDSRLTGGGGPLASGATRDLSVANSIDLTTGAIVTNDVVPAGAYAITYNLTAADCTNQGFLAIYGKGGTFKASALNWFTTGEVVANGGVVTLGGDRQVTVQAGGGGTTNFVIDITGYYI